MEETPQPEEMQQKKSWVVPSLLILLGLAMGAVFVYMSNSTDVVPDDQTRNLDSARAVLDAAGDTFWQDRDYGGSIEQLESELQSLEIAAVDREKNIQELDAEGSLKLALASGYLRFEQQRGLELFSEIFNNDQYSNEIKSGALLAAMWHLASHTGSDVSVNQVREWAFSADKFGNALMITEEELDLIIQPNQVAQYLARGFRLVPSLTNNKSKHFAAESFSYKMDVLAALADFNNSIRESGRTSYELAELQQSVELSKLFDETIVSIRDFEIRLTEFIAADIEAEYNQRLLISLYSIQRTHEMLHQIGFDNSDDIFRLNSEITQYADAHQEESYLTAIIIVESSLRTLCPLVHDAQFNVENLDTGKIMQLLDRAYGLSEEDRKRRTGLASIANKPRHTCYEPFVFVANEIDSNFKDFLINGVGNWSENNFISSI
jgi:hypothetical protein